MATETMRFTGRNSPEVRAWLSSGLLPRRLDGSERLPITLFITKSMSGPTDLQAWHYVVGKEPYEELPAEWKGVTAAAYDPVLEEWLPVRRGDTIVRHRDGSLAVLSPLSPTPA